MAKIEELDANFKQGKADENGIVYYNCMEKPFSLHGFYKPLETGKFLRLPGRFSKEESVNEGVRSLLYHTSGGRVRFVTDSCFINIRVNLSTPVCFMPHMTQGGIQGFDLYAAPVDQRKNPVYQKTFFPIGVTEEEGTYSGTFQFAEKVLREITINFPLYNGVESLFIGLKEGCVLKEAEPYSVELPMVFYGSSITQGGCASRPGTNYTHLLSRWLGRL